MLFYHILTEAKKSIKPKVKKEDENDYTEDIDDEDISDDDVEETDDSDEEVDETDDSTDYTEDMDDTEETDEDAEEDTTEDDTANDSTDYTEDMDDTEETDETSEDDTADDSTDYTEDMGEDTSTDDTESTNNEDENLNDEQNDKDSSDEKTKKLRMYKNFLSLYNVLKESIDTIDNISKNDIIENQIIINIKKNFIIITDYLFQYLEDVFDKSSYVEVLYAYDYFLKTYKINLEMLKKIGVLSGKMNN